MHVKKSINWGYLLLGILCILVSLLAFKDPASDLLAIVLFFGVTAVIKGAFELMVRGRMKNSTGGRFNWLIAIGILDIVIGLFLLFNLQASLIALPYVFALWFIVDSVSELVMAGTMKVLGQGVYWLTIILNILGIIIGVMLFFNPLSSILTLAFLVGIYFMTTGIFYLVAAF